MTSPTFARGMKEYINPARLAPLKKSVRDQMREIEGRHPFNMGLYHNPAYESMMHSLVESRKAYKQTHLHQTRKQIAKQQLSEWTKYISARKQELPSEFQLPHDFKEKMDEVWQRMLGNSQGEALHDCSSDMPAHKIHDFHYEFMKQFRFTPPIEARLLMQMVHPHQGYLSHFPGSFSQQDIIDIYDKKLVASMERQLGQDLLASEIAALTYWQAFDKTGEGAMDLKTFAQFMKTFRYALDGSIGGFKREFKFALFINSGEISNDLPENQQLIRFDFYRYLFLERNL